MNLTNQVLQNFYRKVVAPALSKVPMSVRGTVTEYYPEQNRCKVRFRDPNNRSTLEVVMPVMIMGGISNPGPFPGEEVMISFPGGNYTFGIILGVTDLNYSSSTRGRRQTHRRKGAWLPDSIGSREGEL